MSNPLTRLRASSRGGVAAGRQPRVASSSSSSTAGRSAQSTGAPALHDSNSNLLSTSYSSSLNNVRGPGLFAGVNRRAVQLLRQQKEQLSRPQSTSLSAVATAAPPAVVSTPRSSAINPVSMMKVVEVPLGDRSYPIYIGTGLLEQGELLRQHIPGKKVLIVTNETIAPLYLERCTAALTGGNSGISVESVVLPDGEEFKTLEVLNQVFDKALTARLDRGVTFLALGGGVIGDMTGFAAACYQRGVHFVQVPTTVMAQVDSSVGGKTGVNHPLGKNMIGAFYQPRCVLIDVNTLSTLPDRELASGLSEVIKYGLIRDAALFEWLEGNMDLLLARDPAATAYAIERSCINKAEVVAADEREGGVRATLNLGHTFGHAIETGSGYGAWLHGEAVSAGTVMAADLSYRLGWIDESLFQRVLALLQRAKLPVAPPPAMTSEQFKALMSVDKKVLEGQLRLVLLKGPLGGCVVTGDFDSAKLDECLAHFCGGSSNGSAQQ